MINISDKIWAIISANDRDKLAYMCPYEITQKGDVSAGTKKMMQTGEKWAKPYQGWHVEVIDGKSVQVRDPMPPTNEGIIYDNVPTKGMYIGSSVCRWSTSNKLFNVVDPRGFMVQVPTDNIATLLHHTTVVNGFVQDECVWGRDGGHILLPVNSEVYKEATAKIEKKETGLIKPSQLQYGDVVKFFNNGKADETEYQYIGRVKATWQIRQFETVRTGGYGVPSQKNILTEWQEIPDTKWEYVFIAVEATSNVVKARGEDGRLVYTSEPDPSVTGRMRTAYAKSRRVSTMLNPSIEGIVRNEPVNYELDDVKLESALYSPPKRVSSQFVRSKPNHNCWDLEHKIVSFEYKK